MRVNNSTYFWTISFVLLLLSANISAQYRIKGSLGVDLHAINSSSESNANSYSPNNATRFISNHYVSFANGGSIKTENFANYFLSAMLKGFFTSMKTNTLQLGSYSSPELNNFSGNIIFFPKRSYPLSFFYIKMKDVSLKFNESERSSTELLTPGLAILQKRRINEEKYGTYFSSKLFSGATLDASFNNQKTDNSYDYDFDEDRKIIISSLELPGDIFTNTVSVIFNNKIKDDSVRIISGTFNEIIPPEFTFTITFDSGSHFIDVIPLHNYMQSSISVNLNHEKNYVINIDVEKFPVKNDIINDNTEAMIDFSYLTKKLKIKTNFSHIDLFSASTHLKELSDGFKNSLLYQISRKFDIVINSEKTARESITGGIDKLITDNSKNLTTLNFIQRKGLIGSVSHDYKLDVLETTDGIKIETDNTKYIAKLALPSERYKHHISFNGELSQQNKTGFGRDEATNKSYELRNRMELSSGRLKFVPMSSIKIDSREKIGDTLKSESEGLTMNSSFEISQTDNRLLGEVSTKLGHVFTKTTENNSTKTSSQVLWDFLFRKDLSEKHTISLSTSHTWRFTGDFDTEERDTITQQSVLVTKVTPTEYSNTISINYNSSQFKDVEFSTNFSLANAKGSKTTGILFKLDTYIPYIKFPFSTEIIKQYRDLEGMPRQASFKTESEISYRYNQIDLTISHIFSTDELILDTYKFYELSISITRKFGI